MGANSGNTADLKGKEELALPDLLGLNGGQGEVC